MNTSTLFRLPITLPLSLTPKFANFPILKPLNRRRIIAQAVRTEKKSVDLVKIGGLAVNLGAVLATVAEPAMAVTGVNNEEDLLTVVIQSAAVGFWYLIIMPPIIMTWVRTRFYRRKLLEMYLQFMCVFVFSPGVLLWAPFLNFRKLPRDPSMKYPWSVPEDPAKVKSDYKKYPYAMPEDYD